MNTAYNHLDSVLSQWFPLGGWKLGPGPSGMNNTTHYIEVNGAHYVLRIYEIGRASCRERV